MHSNSWNIFKVLVKTGLTMLKLRPCLNKTVFASLWSDEPFKDIKFTCQWDSNCEPLHAELLTYHIVVCCKIIFLSEETENSWKEAVDGLLKISRYLPTLVHYDPIYQNQNLL